MEGQRATSRAARVEKREYITLLRPRCPRCGSDRVRTQRTETRYDDATCQRKACRVCGNVFFVVWE